MPDGFAEFSHKEIKIAYEHILGMELDLTKKGKLSIGGFHHDYKNGIEKSGIIEFSSKILDEHGFYKTTLLENGNIIKKATFFPAEWSRENVIRKIHEAYNDFKTGGAIALEDRGKYVIRGKTQEGVKIEMYVTKNGKIVTAYPILESL